MARTGFEGSPEIGGSRLRDDDPRRSGETGSGDPRGFQDSRRFSKSTNTAIDRAFKAGQKGQKLSQNDMRGLSTGAQKAIRAAFSGGKKQAKEDKVAKRTAAQNKAAVAKARAAKARAAKAAAAVPKKKPSIPKNPPVPKKKPARRPTFTPVPKLKPKDGRGTAAGNQGNIVVFKKTGGTPFTIKDETAKFAFNGKRLNPGIDASTAGFAIRELTGARRGADNKTTAKINRAIKSIQDSLQKGKRKTGGSSGAALVPSSWKARRQALERRGVDPKGMTMSEMARALSKSVSAGKVRLGQLAVKGTADKGKKSKGRVPASRIDPKMERRVVPGRKAVPSSSKDRQAALRARSSSSQRKSSTQKKAPARTTRTAATQKKAPARTTRTAATKKAQPVRRTWTAMTKALRAKGVNTKGMKMAAMAKRLGMA